MIPTVSFRLVPPKKLRVGHVEWEIEHLKFSVSLTGQLRAVGTRTNGSSSWVPLEDPPKWLARIITDVVETPQLRYLVGVDRKHPPQVGELIEFKLGLATVTGRVQEVYDGATGLRVVVTYGDGTVALPAREVTKL